eukprot:3941819-Rhodomonas_salina.2
MEPSATSDIVLSFAGGGPPGSLLVSMGEPARGSTYGSGVGLLVGGGGAGVAVDAVDAGVAGVVWAGSGIISVVIVCAGDSGGL